MRHTVRKRDRKGEIEGEGMRESVCEFLLSFSLPVFIAVVEAKKSFRAFFPFSDTQG